MTNYFPEQCNQQATTAFPRVSNYQSHESDVVDSVTRNPEVYFAHKQVHTPHPQSSFTSQETTSDAADRANPASMDKNGPFVSHLGSFTLLSQTLLRDRHFISKFIKAEGRWKKGGASRQAWPADLVCD